MVKYALSAMAAALAVSGLVAKPPQAPPVESHQQGFSWAVTDRMAPCGMGHMCECGCNEGGACTCTSKKSTAVKRIEGTTRADGCIWTNEDGGYWFRWTQPSPPAVYSAPVVPMQFYPQQMRYAPMQQSFQGFGGFGGMRGCAGGG